MTILMNIGNNLYTAGLHLYSVLEGGSKKITISMNIGNNGQIWKVELKK